MQQNYYTEIFIPHPLHQIFYLYKTLTQIILWMNAYLQTTVFLKWIKHTHFFTSDFNTWKALISLALTGRLS